jgi:hypothetical protein
LQSIAHRSVTVVTVMTLIFAPVLKNNHWTDKLVDKDKTTDVVACDPGQPCPAKQHVLEKVKP